MTNTTKEREVLRQYRLIDDKNELVQVILERPEEHPLGPGPKVQELVIQRLISADSTPDQRWLDWIFFQAAGGMRAKEANSRAMEQIKERFIDERVNGFQNPDTKERYAPVSKQDAEARWLAVEPRWQEMLVTADQDIVDHLGVFGYHRDWPGKDKVYERVAQTVSKFLKLFEKIGVMNHELLEQPGPQPVALLPTDYANLEDLEKVNRRVERYFVSKRARNDVRAENILDNKYVRVVCPLTYAASVRYGFENWSFSSRTTFEEILASDSSSFRDAWKQTTQKNVLVFVYWKLPMPGWIARKEDKFVRYELTNLALEIPRSGNMEGMLIHDEENAATLSTEQLIKMIQDEPTRPTDPAEEEMPVKRGPNAYTDAASVTLRMQILTEVLDKVGKWAKAFRTDDVQSDVYAEDVA